MNEDLLRTMHDEARSIFHHALRSSSIAAAFDRRFPAAFPFAEYDRIYRMATEWRGRTLRYYPKPTIAVVNGYCFGGAF